MADKLRILIAASEMVPFFKTGGLADVTGTLPAALSEYNLEVRIMLPHYKKASQYPIQSEIPVHSFVVPNRVSSPNAVVNQIDLDVNFQIFLIENDAYFNRDKLYGTSDGDYSDNIERFTFYNAAVIEYIKQSNWIPNVIHCHDWQAGLIPAYIKAMEDREPLMQKIGTLFTIHNLAYQGIFPNEFYPLTNLPWEDYVPEKIEYYGDFSFLKAGIVYSDKISTVSKQYCYEIQTPDFGFGMDGILRLRKNDLHGILNGIDYEQWNPATDSVLPENYTIESFTKKLSSKQTLQKRLGLPVTGSERLPLIGMVTRLADQKGLDLLSAQFDALMQERIQLVILGTGDERYHELLTAMAQKYSDKFSLNLFF